MLIYGFYALQYLTYYTFYCLFWIENLFMAALWNLVYNCGYVFFSFIASSICTFYNFITSSICALPGLISNIGLAIKDFFVTAGNVFMNFLGFCWSAIEFIFVDTPNFLYSVLSICIEYYAWFIHFSFKNLEAMLVFLKDCVIELFNDLCILLTSLSSAYLSILRFLTFGCIDKEGWLWSKLGGEKPDIFSILTLNTISVTFFVALGLLIVLLIVRYKYSKLFKILKSTCAPVAFSLFIKLNMLIGRRNTTLLTVFTRLFSLQALNSEQTAIVLFAALLIPFAILSLTESVSFSNVFIGLVIVSFDALLSKDFFILTVQYLGKLKSLGLFSGNSNFNILIYVCTAFFRFYCLIFALQVILKICKILFQKKNSKS